MGQVGGGGSIMVLLRVVSGGQTGADQAGWRAASAAGIPTEGAMPRGFFTEAGPRPEFAALYGAHQMLTSVYEDRTRGNVHNSDATLWFGSEKSPACAAPLRACPELSRPWLSVTRPEPGCPQPADVARWIAYHRFSALNVAGNRESKSPGIGAWVERYLAEVFRLLAGLE